MNLNKESIQHINLSTYLVLYW